MRHDYLIDMANLPPVSKDRLRFNKELFQAQTKCLGYSNMIFGLMSMLCVLTGWFILNQQHHEDAKQHILCVNDYEWVYLSLAGTILGTLHQALILMQINITQFVMVKIPRKMKIFEEPEQKHTVGMALK